MIIALPFFTGDDGAFGINSITGAVTVIKNPDELKKEVYELKIRVGMCFFLHTDHD